MRDPARIPISRWIAVAAAAVLVACAAEPPEPAGLDALAALRFMTGRWEGSAEGQAGTGMVAREYHFVLGGRYLLERNKTTYPPQERNKAGEVHEHWSLFSQDRVRNTLVLRQFHSEGFVNTYAFDAEASRDGKLVFESVAFENFDNRWRARETYTIAPGGDALTETFELASPGNAFGVYSVTRLHRAP